MSSRLNAIRTLLQAQDLSHILITDSQEAEYLCGFRASSISLLISSDTAVLYTDFRYIQQAELAVSQEWRTSLTKGSHFKALARSLQGATSLSLGFQDTHLTVAQFTKLKEALPLSAHYSPLGTQLSSLFMAKTATEINAIRTAASIADQAYTALISTLAIGQSERDVATKLDSLMQSMGSQKPSFDTIVLFGERSSLPHGVPSSEVLLQEGDWILIDFGGTVQGFCSDMTRTAVYGTATSDQKTIYAIVAEAQKLGRDFAQASITASSLDTVVRDHIVSQGYGEYFGHGTGHGVGLRIHEAPAINTQDTTILTANMVITIEPGIYIPQQGGVRIEDLVLITDDGIELLSNTPRTLLEIVPTNQKDRYGS